MLVLKSLDSAAGPLLIIDPLIVLFTNSSSQICVTTTIPNRSKSPILSLSLTSPSQFPSLKKIASLSETTFPTAVCLCPHIRSSVNAAAETKVKVAAAAVETWLYYTLLVLFLLLSLYPLSYIITVLLHASLTCAGDTQSPRTLTQICRHKVWKS